MALSRPSSRSRLSDLVHLDPIDSHGLRDIDGRSCVAHRVESIASSEVLESRTRILAHRNRPSDLSRRFGRIDPGGTP